MLFSFLRFNYPCVCVHGCVLVFEVREKAQENYLHQLQLFYAAAIDSPIKMPQTVAHNGSSRWLCPL